MDNDTWVQAHIMELPLVLPLHDKGKALGRLVATIAKRGGLSRDWYDLTVNVHIHAADFGELVRKAVIADSPSGELTVSVSHDTLRGARSEALRFMDAWAGHMNARLIRTG